MYEKTKLWFKKEAEHAVSQLIVSKSVAKTYLWLLDLCLDFTEVIIMIVGI